MKNFTKFLVLAGVLLLASAEIAFSQPGPQGAGPNPNGSWGPWGNYSGASAPITVDGKLALAGEYPSIVAKDKTYVLGVPNFYSYAYKDGIKDGSTAKAEGFVVPMPGKDELLFVTKLTVGNKVYDFSSAGFPAAETYAAPNNGYFGGPGAFHGRRGFHHGYGNGYMGGGFMGHYGMMGGGFMGPYGTPPPAPRP